MTASNLVTAGENIKVWKEGILLDQFVAHHSATSQVTWSPDGNFLASSSKTGEKITVSHFKCLRATIELKSDNHVQTFVRFGHTTSRYLATCGKQSQVLLWDIKLRKIEKKFNTSFDAVTCLGFNVNDTHIACGSPDGSTVFINTTSSFRNKPMVTSKKKPIYALAFSRTKNALLGTVSEDGSFYLWNVNQQKLIHSFDRIHVAPATGLSFSPVNDKLAVTVGFDKRFIFYDITNKKVLRTTTLEDPLTCLDFLDGEKLVIGTMKGEVLTFDLRASAAPINIFPAYESEINSLQFQKFNTVAKDDLNWNLDEVTAEANARLQLDSQNGAENETSFVREIDVTQVFSPLQDSSPCYRPFNVLNDSPLCTPDLLENRSPKRASLKYRHDLNLSAPDMSITKKSPNRTMVKSPVPLITFSDETQLRSVTPNARKEVQQQGDESSVVVATASAAHSFNANLLKNIVSDAMDDCKEAIHKDVVNLHVEMLKKFKIQQMQIEKLFEHYSINNDLLDEIEKLREENARLKMNY